MQRKVVLHIRQMMCADQQCYLYYRMRECITKSVLQLPAYVPRWRRNLLIQVAHLPLALSTWIRLEPYPHFLRAECPASQHIRRVASGTNDERLCAWNSNDGSLSGNLCTVPDHTKKAHQHCTLHGLWRCADMSYSPAGYGSCCSLRKPTTLKMSDADPCWRCLLYRGTCKHANPGYECTCAHPLRLHVYAVCRNS